MSRLLIWTVLVSCVWMALFSGCRSIAPPVNYYTLSSISSQASDTNASGTDTPSIGIGSVELPGTINQLEMVRQTGPHRLEFSTVHRWADYPDRLVPRVLQQNLSVLLPDARVYSAPWPMGFKPDVMVSFQFLDLIATANQKMKLTAEWTIIRGDDPSTVRSHRRTYWEPIPGSGFDDLAIAHSQMLETFCREVAGTLMVP